MIVLNGEYEESLRSFLLDREVDIAFGMEDYEDLRWLFLWVIGRQASPIQPDGTLTERNIVNA